MAEGRIGPGTEVVEASSGNTALAIALLGAVMGFRVRIYMSELASVERRQIIMAYGAKVVITPGLEHTKGARIRAIGYCERNPQTTFFLNQHGNPNNGRAHYTTTGPEIWEQTGGKIDIMIIGLGTSGTFDGLSTFFKEMDPNIRIICFEPASSPVYSGGKQGKHRLIGIGPGFQTENFLRSKKLADELILVPDEAAFEMTRKIAMTEGLLVGVTSGAAAWVAEKVSKRPGNEGKTICCLFYDTGERYLSTPGLFPSEGVEFED
ncbi:MAG: PLP-dependent cysteine synthase family protein [Thermoplasmatota archaeon]